MNYLNLFAESGTLENNYDPTSRVGSLIEHAPSEAMSPLDLLIAAEEWLIEEHNMTFIQAVAMSVKHEPARRPTLRLKKPRQH
jgi:hypothetical protein